jgi:SAM-dependent methyltransferase
MTKTQTQNLSSEQLQREHYEAISEEYEAHYSDASSLDYRAKFIYEPMFRGIDLSNQRVLDAMCGGGPTTEFLVAQGARVTGLDISPTVMAAFESRWPQCEAVCGSALDTGLPDESFDCVVVVGGLHHVHPYLNETTSEFHRLLKRGGHFCFTEPHYGSLPDVVRRFWYQYDNLFSENEESIDVESLKRDFASRFDFKQEFYLGNLAYLLVLNSMVFRIPLSWKPVYTPTLLKVESILNRIQGKRLSCYVVAQWQKK